jgi:hypothetical protein
MQFLLPGLEHRVLLVPREPGHENAPLLTEEPELKP